MSAIVVAHLVIVVVAVVVVACLVVAWPKRAIKCCVEAAHREEDGQVEEAMANSLWPTYWQLATKCTESYTEKKNNNKKKQQQKINE